MGPPKILSGKDLEIGDVIFCGKSKSIKRTEIIQNTTDGAYVHCSVYVGRGDIVDLTSDGIRSIHFSDFINEYSYCAVTRCPSMNKHREKKLVSFIDKCLNEDVRYNYIGAALLPYREYFHIKKHYWLFFGKKYRKFKPRSKFLGKNRYFCSEFIVECFKACDSIRQNDSYFDSHMWSPSGLAEENIFHFEGYVSNAGFEAVSSDDPFIKGCDWVLTPEGQERVKNNEKDFYLNVDNFENQADQSN